MALVLAVILLGLVLLIFLVLFTPLSEVSPIL